MSPVGATRSAEPAVDQAPTFFETPADFRAWLEHDHTSADSLWVGYRKKGSGRASITWPESVDEALCFGWIDGIRKAVDAESYKIRFTPRKAGSIWSSVNVGRVQALIGLGRMQPAGLAAFERRRSGRSGLYSHEQGDVELPEPYLGLLQADGAAWEFFRMQPASYRKAASWWVVGAKRDETRRRRLDTLVEHSARGERLPQFVARKPPG